MKLVAAVIAFALASVATARAADEAAVQRGAYLYAAGDCDGCHTDKKAGGAQGAGGRALATPFGTFFGPNITPDRETGIGDWSLADFRRALRQGKDDEGHFLYPVFPFPAFTGMTDQDIGDLYAYLQSLPPLKRPWHPHEVKFPFGWRFLLIGWRTLFFSEGPLQSVARQSAEWNRGRYLAEAVVHCEECHTPRNFMGGLDRKHAFAGNPNGPDGQDAPDITPDKKDGIGDWKLEDIVEVLKTGSTPDGEFVGKGMAEVVDGTEKLTDADRHAIAVYIQSLPALPKTPR